MSEAIQTKPVKEKAKGSLIFSLGSVASVGSYFVMSYISYALTESVGMSAIIVGSILLFSRIFDGFTDIVAGFIIDRTNSKLGKARPFELFYIPLWIFVVLSFSVPGNLSNVGKIVWVFLTYNLCQSVCYTFTNSIDAIRLKRSFKESVHVKVVTISTILVTVASLIIAMSLPILISVFESQPHGWTIISSIYAIPCVIFGLLRFFLLKEFGTEEITKTEKISIVDTLKAVIQNKYILFILIAYLMIAINNSLGSMSTYFFKYVYGDVAIASIPSLVGCLSMVLLVLLPKAIEKLGTQKTALLCFMIACLASLCKNVMATNIIWFTAFGMAVNVAITFISSLKNIILIECMDYGEWKTNVKLEGIYTAACGMVDKIGMGLGSFFIGLILQIGGYDAELAAQPASALASMQFGVCTFPAIIFAIGFLAMLGYKLSGQIGNIRAELAQRKEQA